MKYNLIEFPIRGDERGYLTAIEAGKDIPFDIKRVFYIYNTQGRDVVRGDHANRKSKFILVMVSGSCKIKVFSKDKQEIVELDKPNKALFLENMVWKEMYDFSDNAVMMVLASELYDKDEYINSYDEFLKEVEE